MWEAVVWQCRTSSVQIEVGDNVTEVCQNLLACLGAGRVGRTHVRGVFPNDVSDGHLVLYHLIVDLFFGDIA